MLTSPYFVAAVLFFDNSNMSSLSSEKLLVMIVYSFQCSAVKQLLET